MQDVAGLTLTYQNSLAPGSDYAYILTPTHLLAASPIPIGKNEQLTTAMATSQDLIAVALTSPNELVFIDRLDHRIITQIPTKGEVSVMEFSGDLLCVAYRDSQSLAIYSTVNYEYLNTLCNLVPQNTPFVPRFMLKDPSGLGFIVESGLRVLSIQVNLTQEKNIENKIINSCTFKAYEIAVGALCGNICTRYLILGYQDSTIQIFCKYNQVYQMPPPYPADLLDKSDTLSFEAIPFKEALHVPESFYKSIQTLNVPQLLPKDCVSPKFGISNITSSDQTVFVASRGGLIMKFKFILDLKEEAIEEKYTDSEGENSEIEVNYNDITQSLKFQAAANLDLDALLSPCVSSSNLSSVLAQASSSLEENITWTDARSCIEVLNFQFAKDQIYAIIYDPVSNSAFPVKFDDFINQYTILLQIIQLSHQFISVYSLIYYQQIPALKQHLMQVQNFLQFKNQQNNKISLLSLASGSIKNDDSELFITNSHVPSAVFTNSLKILKFQTNQTKFAYSSHRCAFATKEGHIYLFSYESQETEIKEELTNNNGIEDIEVKLIQKEPVSGFKVVANCKIIDAILDIDINPTGTQIVAACTDAIRIFQQNGRFLICQHEIPIKMAQKVLFASTGFVVNVAQNNLIIQLDPLTGLITNQLQGHNDVIKDMKYLTPTLIRDAFLATVDADGVLYIWDRRGKRVIEHVTRSKVSSIGSFWYNRSKTPHYCLMAADGMIKIFDIINGNFVYQGVIQMFSTNSYAVIKDVIFDYQKQVFIASDQFGCVHVVMAPGQEQLKQGRSTMLGSQYQVGEHRYAVAKACQSVPAIDEIIKYREIPHNCKLSLSPDNKYLVISGTNSPSTLVLIRFNDGFLPCIKRHIKDIDVIGDKNIDDYAFVDKCIRVDLGLFQVLQKVLTQLEDRKIEMKLEFDHTVKVVQQRHQRGLEQQRTQSEEEIHQAQNMTVEVAKTAEEEAEEFEKKLAEVGRTHSDALQKIELQYRTKVAQINNQKQSILDTITNLNMSHDQQIQSLHSTRVQTLHQETQNYDKKEQKRRSELQNLQQKLHEISQEYQEMQDQADQDCDTQIQELIGRSKAQVDLKQNQIEAIQAETGMIKNKFASIKKQILTFQSNVLSCENNITALIQAMDEQQQELKNAEKEVQQRQESIIQREKHIYELKRQAKELEKHRFVLDFRIKDLRKLIQPREQEIHDLSEQVREIGNELENYHKAIDMIEKQIQESRSEESGLKSKLANARDDFTHTRGQLQFLSHTLSRIIEDHGQLSYDKLKDRIVVLLQFGGEEKIDAEQAKADGEKFRHKKFLVEAARELSKQINQGKDDVVQENARIIEENTELLKEAAVLRREIQKIIHAPVSQQNTENSKVFQARLTAQDAEIKRLRKRVIELEEMEQ
ncbi:hypothetical protein SS50377_20124 [Spironucleus salmonicida]|uniref:Uncharacterized protein n=1 Tax=Spironucleus salmonicida TaxID=348837 RepID=V6LN97_9EUKA|nr:hypothetical protein SS50377_20124 [Spironucleus salmonicida]|eukprot:EST45181.1 hypothetical protein SS50377_14753 [Spironucleus salmonicida]